MFGDNGTPGPKDLGIDKVDKDDSQKTTAELYAEARKVFEDRKKETKVTASSDKQNTPDFDLDSIQDEPATNSSPKQEAAQDGDFDLDSIQEDPIIAEQKTYIVGNSVKAPRSNGQIEDGWKIESISPDGIATLKKTTTENGFPLTLPTQEVSLEDIKKWNEEKAVEDEKSKTEFKKDDIVTIKNPNSGEMDPGWRVSAVHENKNVIVRKTTFQNGFPGLLETLVTQDELDEWNKKASSEAPETPAQEISEESKEENPAASAEGGAGTPASEGMRGTKTETEEKAAEKLEPNTMVTIYGEDGKEEEGWLYTETDEKGNAILFKPSKKDPNVFDKRMIPEKELPFFKKKGEKEAEKPKPKNTILDIVRENRLKDLNDPEVLREVLGLPEDFTDEEKAKKFDEFSKKIARNPELAARQAEIASAISADTLRDLKSKEQKEVAEKYKEVQGKLDRDFDKYVSEINKKAEPKGLKKFFGTYLRNAPVRMALGVTMGLAASAVQTPAMRTVAIIGRTVLASFGFGTAAESGRMAKLQRDAVTRFAACKSENGKYDKEKTIEAFRQLTPEVKARIMASLVETTERRSEKVSEELYENEQKAIAEAESKRNWPRIKFDELRNNFSKLSTKKKLALGIAIALVSTGAGAAAGVALGGAALAGGVSLAGGASVLGAAGTTWGIGVSGLIGFSSGLATSTREKMSNFSEHSQLIDMLGREYFGEQDFDPDKLKDARKQVSKEIIGSRKRGIALGVVTANAALLLSGVRAMAHPGGGETPPVGAGAQGARGEEIMRGGAVAGGTRVPENAPNGGGMAGIDNHPQGTRSIYQEDIIPGGDKLAIGENHAPGDEIFSGTQGSGNTHRENIIPGGNEPEVGDNQGPGSDGILVDDGTVRVREVHGLKHTDFDTARDGGGASEAAAPDTGKHFDRYISPEQMVKGPTLHLKDEYFALDKENHYIHPENVGVNADKHLAENVLRGYMGRTNGHFENHDQFNAARDALAKDWQEKGFFNADGSLSADVKTSDLVYYIDAVPEAHSAILNADPEFFNKGSGTEIVQPGEERPKVAEPNGEQPNTVEPNGEQPVGDRAKNISEQKGVSAGDSEALKTVEKVNAEPIDPSNFQWKAGRLDLFENSGSTHLNKEQIEKVFQSDLLKPHAKEYLHNLIDSGRIKPDQVIITPDHKHLMFSDTLLSKKLAWDTSFKDTFLGIGSKLKSTVDGILGSNPDLNQGLNTAVDQQPKIDGMDDQPSQNASTGEQVYTAHDAVNQPSDLENQIKPDGTLPPSPQPEGSPPPPPQPENPPLVPDVPNPSEGYSSTAIGHIENSKNYMVNIQGQEPISVPGTRLNQLVEEAKKYFSDKNAVFKSPLQERESINLYVLDHLKK